MYKNYIKILIYKCYIKKIFLKILKSFLNSPDTGFSFILSTLKLLRELRVHKYSGLIFYKVIKAN